MLANVNRMHGVVSAKHNYFLSVFDQIEAQEISLNKSLSHYKDTDIAEESSTLIREQIRQQSAGAMFTQANSQAQFVLNLLP